VCAALYGRDELGRGLRPVRELLDGPASGLSHRGEGGSSATVCALGVADLGQQTPVRAQPRRLSLAASIRAVALARNSLVSTPNVWVTSAAAWRSACRNLAAAS
jgi:hypothetical protein